MQTYGFQKSVMDEPKTVHELCGTAALTRHFSKYRASEASEETFTILITVSSIF